MSACKILLADGHYTARHNRVCSYLHWKICGEYGIQTKQVWEHEPAPITATEQVSIFYDKPIVLGRYAKGGALKPDIVVWDKVKKVAKVIEVTCPTLQNARRSQNIKI